MASAVNRCQSSLRVPSNAIIHYPEGLNFKPLDRLDKSIRYQFQHKSEKAVTEFMNRYGIGWDYEGNVFVIDFHRDAESRLFVADGIFTPDLYLPELCLHLELTSMKPDLRTEKNRKIRKLKTHFPHTDIVLAEYREGIKGELYNNGENIRIFDGVDGAYCLGRGGHKFNSLEAAFNYLFITRGKMFMEPYRQGPAPRELALAFA